MNKTHRKLLLIAVGLLVTAAAVVYFLRGMRGHWAEMGQAFAKARYLYLLPSVGLIGVMYALRVVRWRLFLNPIKVVPYSAITSATCIGFMATCVLPLRPGEIIRPYMLHRKSGISFGHAAGTAPGLERVFDLIGACFLLLLTWFAVWAHVPAHAADAAPAETPAARSGAPAPTAAGEVPDSAESQGSGARLGNFVQLVRQKGLYLAALMVAGLAVLGAAALAPSAMLKLAGFFCGALPASWNQAVMRILSAAVQALGFLRSPARVAAAILLSFAIWTCYPVSTYYLARGFGLDLPFAGALLTQSIVTAAVAAPQAPGFFGTFQWAAQWGAQLFGVSTGDAGAFAMMMWAVNVVPITVVGLGFLSYEGLSLGRLAQASQRAADGTSTPDPGG